MNNHIKIKVLTAFLGISFSGINAQEKRMVNEPIEVNAAKHLADFLEEPDDHGWLEFKPNSNVSVADITTKYKLDLGLGNDDTFVPDTTFGNAGIVEDENGGKHYRFALLHKGVVIDGIDFAIHTFNGSNDVWFCNGYLPKKIDANVSASIAENSALEIAMSHFTNDQFLWQTEKASKMKDSQYKNMYEKPKGNLVIVENTNTQKYKLAWKFSMFTLVAKNSKNIFIDASSGEIIKQISLSSDCINKTSNTVYDGSRTFSVANNYNSTVFYTSIPKNCSGLSADINVYNNQFSSGISNTSFTNVDLNSGWLNPYYQSMYAATKTLNYCGSVGLNSYNNNGSEFNLTINTTIGKQAYCHNAGGGNSYFEFGYDMSNGEQVLGVDVVGHEFMHAVVNKYISGSLTGSAESYFINEGLADIFGERVQEEAQGGANSWNFFDNSSTPFRSLSNPHSYGNGDPTYYGFVDSDWENSYSCSPSSSNDNCYSHTNCTLIGYWFYILTHGASGYNVNHCPYNVTAVDKWQAAYIVLNAVKSGLVSNSSNIMDFRRAMLNSSIGTYGCLSEQTRNIAEAFWAIGVGGKFWYGVGNRFLQGQGTGANIGKMNNQYFRTNIRNYGGDISIKNMNEDLVGGQIVSIGASGKISIEGATVTGIINGPTGFFTLQNSNLPCDINNVGRHSKPNLEVQQEHKINDITTSIVSVFPNPFRNEVSIASFGADIASITVTNLVGQIIYTSTNLQGQKLIELKSESYPSGSYLIAIKLVDGSNTTKKLMKL